MMKLPFIKRKPKDPVKEPKQKGRVRRTAEQVFGFEKPEKEKFLKSPELDEKEVVAALAKLATDVNWLKRLLWLVGGSSVAGYFFGGGPPPG